MTALARLLSREHFNSAGIVFIVVFLHLAGYSVARSQRYLTTFGLVSELNAPHDARSIASGDFNGDGLMDLAVAGGTQVRFYFQEQDTAAFSTVTLEIHAPILKIQAAALNNDRFSDLIVVTDMPAAIHVFLARSRGKLFESWSVEILEPFECLAIGDITNDRKPDLILYGKKELGARVFPGNGNGTFREMTTVFTDYSFSTLSVGSPYRDKLNDVIATNWISNQILVFSAFGGMKYSEPAVVNCPSEAALLCTAYLTSSSERNLIAAFPDEHVCRTYALDGLGGFQLLQSFPLDINPTDLLVSDINGDGKQDLGIFSIQSKELIVKLNDGQGILSESVPFAAGSSPVGCTLFRQGHTALINAAIIDSSQSQLRILWSAGLKQEQAAERIYAAGLNPAGLVVADIDHDGWDDVVAANRGSNTLSLFLNQGEGMFGGQISFGGIGHPEFLSYIARDDSTAIFLATNSEAEQISLMEVNLHQYSHTTYALPSQGRPTVLSTRVDPRTKYIHIYCLEREAVSHYATMIELEQIAGNRFVEHPLGPPVSLPLVDAAMGDFDGDGTADIAYLTYDKKRRSEELFQAKGLEHEKFQTGRLIYTTLVQEAVMAHLWAAKLDTGKPEDLIVNFQQPENTLFFFWGREDSTLTPSTGQSLNGVTVGSYDRLRLFDMNGDGRPDIVLENSLTKSIRVLLGRERESFVPGMRLSSTERLGGFAVGDLNNDLMPELLESDETRGVVKVVSLQEDGR